MTLELLIHSIVRQTTILIAQLATSAGARAPLAQIADQVFLDLVRELERQGVSRPVSADMFGLGLRTYQRKIQRLSESETDRGRSLWEAVLEFVREQNIVTRAAILLRFSRDDEAQVRSVVRDLCESRLVFSSGAGHSTIYRAATDGELRTLHQMKPQEGLDELVWAFVYRLGPLSREQMEKEVAVRGAEVDAALERLVAAGRIEKRVDGDGETFRSARLFIPVDAPVGWEAAVFDHFKAMVNTISARLNLENGDSGGRSRLGGRLYTLDVWDGHPFAAEAVETLSRVREQLRAQREKIERYNEEHGIPETFTRVVHYVGQYLIVDEPAACDEAVENEFKATP